LQFRDIIKKKKKRRTAIGFTVGLIGSILVDIFLGRWIADWIDNNVK
jgi:hypothetical protein